MGIAVIDTLTRGESGLGTFAVADQDDLKLGYVSVTDIVQRDAIPEWKRTPYMTVRVISTNEEYTLGINITIAGQVWTLKGELPSNVVLEDDIFDMSGFIKSELIQNITLGASYVVPDETAQLALTTLTGNFIIRTDTGDVYVKLNDTNPALIGDFALVTYPGAVTSVNSMTGNVVISIANLLADGTNLTNFQQAVDDSPAVDALQVSVGANTTAIGVNATAITNNFNTLQAQITPNTAQIAVNTADILALQLASAGGYTVVEAEGIALQAQDTINVLNGLTAVDDDPNTRTNFKLGGTLSEHTTIDGAASYNVTFTNLSDFVLDLEAGAEFTITGGSLITAPATTAYSSFNIPHGVAPTAPNNGDIWTTSTSAYARINGVTVDLGAVTPASAYWATAGTSNITGTTQINFNGDSVTFDSSQSDFSIVDTVNAVSVHFGDTWASQGLLYGGDYSLDFVDRSLIDKGYADGAYWKTSGTSTLTAPVTIDLDGNPLDFINVSEFNISGANSLVGIGTLAPTEIFHVVSPNTNSSILLESTSGGGGAESFIKVLGSLGQFVQMQTGRSTTGSGITINASPSRPSFINATGGAGYLDLQVGSTDIVHLTSTQVGIGTIVPTVSTRLDVIGIAGGTSLRVADDANTDIITADNDSHLVEIFNDGGAGAGGGSIFRVRSVSTLNEGRTSLVIHNDRTSTAINQLTIDTGRDGGGNLSTRFINSVSSPFEFQTVTGTNSLIIETNGNIATVINARIGPTGNGALILRTQSNDKLNLANNGQAIWTTTAATSGNFKVASWTGAAHTNQTASTELNSILFNLSPTIQFATGALATQRAFRIQNPTYGFVGASTITDAYSFYVDDAPVAGTNATITNPWAAGFGGNVQIGGTGKLFISTAPSPGTTEDVLVWNATAGEIRKVTQASLGGGGGWALTGTSTLTGATIIDANSNSLTFEGFTTFLLGDTTETSAWQFNANSSFTSYAASTVAASGPEFRFQRQGGASVGANTITADTHVLGSISYSGMDTSSTAQTTSAIRAIVNGTVSSGNVPSDLVFLTSATNTAGLTERLRITSDGRVYGKNLHNNAGSISGTANQYIASGTYTPTATTIENLDSVTESELQYMRVGNVVTVSGNILVNATSLATFSSLRITLPVASNFTQVHQVAGTISTIVTASSSYAGYIYADTANDEAILRWGALSTSDATLVFHFTYLIL